MDVQPRLEKLRARLKTISMPALLVSQAENRRYLSGFTGSAGYLLITAGEQVLATDFRYVEQVKQQAPAYRLVQISGDLATWFPKIVEGLGLTELAFEAEDVSFDFYSRLKSVAEELKLELKPTSGIVAQLRTVKEPGEVELIRRAVALSDAAIAFAARIIRPGMSELRLAWEIEAHMRRHGSEALPFEVIVAAGPNAALPHHRPCDRHIGRRTFW